MASLFLWIGLTMIVALPEVLSLFGLGTASGVLSLVGAVIMVIGSVLLIMKK